MNQPNDNQATALREQIAAHIGLSTDAVERLAEITDRIIVLRARSAALADESGLNKSLVELAEAEKAVAAAVAHGEAQTERAALDALNAVKKSIETKRAALSEHAGLVAALESEAAALDKEAELARHESRQHRKQAFVVMGDILFSEWKESAAAMFAVGAKMLAARNAAGQSVTGFSRLSVPSFDSYDRIMDIGNMMGLARDVTEDCLIAEFSARHVD